MTYVSEESGRPDVFVETFPRSDLRVQISTAGGVQPMWRADGRELFYLALDGHLMGVDTTPSTTFKAGVPHALFPVHSLLLYTKNSYAPTRDGQRFLVNEYSEPTSMIGVVVNWPAALTR